MKYNDKNELAIINRTILNKTIIQISLVKMNMKDKPARRDNHIIYRSMQYKLMILDGGDRDGFIKMDCTKMGKQEHCASSIGLILCMEK